MSPWSNYVLSRGQLCFHQSPLLLFSSPQDVMRTFDRPVDESRSHEELIKTLQFPKFPSCAHFPRDESEERHHKPVIEGQTLRTVLMFCHVSPSCSGHGVQPGPDLPAVLQGVQLHQVLQRHVRAGRCADLPQRRKSAGHALWGMLSFRQTLSFFPLILKRTETLLLISKMGEVIDPTPYENPLEHSVSTAWPSPSRRDFVAFRRQADSSIKVSVTVRASPCSRSSLPFEHR